MYALEGEVHVGPPQRQQLTLSKPRERRCKERDGVLRVRCGPHQGLELHGRQKRDLPAVTQSVFDGKRAFLQSGRECLALNQLHHQVVGTDIV